MNTRQRKLAHRRTIARFRRRLLVATIVIASLATLGAVGRVEKQDLTRQSALDLQHYMAIQCHVQAPNCLDLIKQVEAGNKLTVMSDYNNNYWVEAR